MKKHHKEQLRKAIAQRDREEYARQHPVTPEGQRKVERMAKCILQEQSVVVASIREVMHMDYGEV